MPGLLELGMRHWFTRGQRKQEADLAERGMAVREGQLELARSVEARARRMESYLTKEIDAQIQNWNADNKFQITQEDNGMIKAILTHATEAAKRGDINAANSWMKTLRDNYSDRYKGIGDVVYEPGQVEGEWKVTSIGSGKALKWNPMGDVEEIDLSEDETPAAARFKDIIDMINATRNEMNRLDQKWQESGMYENLVEAAAGNAPGALKDAERYRHLESLHDSLTIDMYGGGSPMPTIQVPQQKVEPVEALTEKLAVPVQEVSMEVPRAALPEQLQDKPEGTKVILKDGRVLEITVKGGRFLTKEEAEAWKAQRSE